jgi:hypothetical protein
MDLVLQTFGYYIEGSHQRKYTYYIGAGNNKNLIFSLLKKRWWWIETNDPLQADFIWTQLKHNSVL